MRRVHRLSLFVLLAACFALSAEEPAKPEQLVEELGNADFDVRTAAAEKLEALGDTARAALEKALTAKDTETRDVARALLQKLKQASLVCMAFDRDGKPAAGAEAQFWVTAGTCRAAGGQAVALEFDERGSVRVGRFATGPHVVAVSMKQFIELSGPGTVNLRPGTNLGLHLVARGATITGRVVGPDGKGISGAKVCLAESDVTQAELDATMRQLGTAGRDAELFHEPTASTDADGAFRMENVRDGVQQCLVAAPEYFCWAGPLIRVREGEKIELPAAVLRPCPLGTITMELLDAKGNPAKNCSLRWTLTPVTDADAAKPLYGLPGQIPNPFAEREIPSVELEEGGKVTLEKHIAGTYDLSVQLYDNNGEELDGDLRQQPQCLEYERRGISVKGGETVDLGKLHPVKCGKVTGKVLSRAGKPRSDVSVQAVPEKELSLLPLVLNDEGAFDLGRASVQTAPVNVEGVYTFKWLRPGRYTFLVWTDNRHVAVIHGVECLEGGETNVPEVRLASERSAATDDIRGTVLTAEGKPLYCAQVNLHFDSGSWGASCDQQGNFSFASVQRRPLSISCRMPGMRPERIDLSQGIPAQPIVIRLHKRLFGTLRVKVADEQGNPLRDARVWPFSNAMRFQLGDNAKERMKRTNADGVVEFAGLADGERELVVEHDDYFPKTAPRVVITAETLHVVTMLPHLQLQGRMEFPPGVKPSVAVVAAWGGDPGACRLAAVNDDGTFKFSGLVPAEYSLTPSAPGLIPAAHCRVELKDGEPAPAPVLKMVPCGAAALRLDPPKRCETVALVPYEQTVSAEIRAGKTDALNFSTATTDAAGRAEFFGDAPGKYRVVLWDHDSEQISDQGTPMSVTRFCGTVDVRPAPPLAELAKMEAVPINVPAARGSVRFEVAARPGTITKQTGGLYVGIFLSGSEAYAESYYYDMRPPPEKQELVVIGTPTADVKLAAGPGRYHAKNLPDGEYTLLLGGAWRDAHGNTVSPESLAPAKTFTIKDGSAVDLGVVQVEPPPPLPKAPMRIEAEELPEADDKQPGFQP